MSWPLWKSSFRGVPFWVDADLPVKGRRVVVHELSGGEISPTEDMGRLQPGYRVDAYLAGSGALVLGHALEAACEAPEASLLVLPMDGPVLAHCTLCRRDRSKDREGYIGYELEFVAAGTSVMSFNPLSVVRGIFDNALSALGIAFK